MRLKEIAEAWAVCVGTREVARVSSLALAQSYALEVYQSKRFLDTVKLRCREKVAPAIREKRLRWYRHIVKCRKIGLGAKGIHIRPIYS